MMTHANPDWTPFEETRIAGLPVVTASRAELVDAMIADCEKARVAGHAHPPRVIFDINGHAISMTGTNGAFRDALTKADVIHSDGGIWVALSKFTRRTIRGRSSTTDLMIDFAQACEREDLSFFILGGTEQANVDFCAYLAEHYPRLKVVGRRNGYFGADDEQEIFATINAAKPDILWVGMGKPREQTFSLKLRDNVKAGWIVTCGGCYNYFVGNYRRAPMWMQNSGLEWLYRMASDPRQFGWRYLTTNPHSISLALWDLGKLRLGR